MWIPRKIESLLIRMAHQFPAVLITGARQTGKTSLLRHLFPDASYLTMDLPANVETARASPETLLDRLREPIIIDEIQYAPTLLKHIKVRIDSDRRPGRFYLAGSQVFGLMEGVSESLAGRCGILDLHTLSYDELSAAGRSLDTASYIFLGGYPEIHAGADIELWFPSYVATYLERDVRNILPVIDLQDFNRFLRVCALRNAHVVNYTDMARDADIAPNTARKWLGLLVASGIIYLLEPFFGNRTKRLIKAPKMFFMDTGLASFLAGFRSKEELFASSHAGAFWEAHAFSEIRKLFSNQGKRIPLYYWRTVNGHEVDLIVEQSPMSMYAIEAKWKEQPDTSDAIGLRALESSSGANNVKKIIAAHTHARYTLSDGTWVMGMKDVVSMLSE